MKYSIITIIAGLFIISSCSTNKKEIENDYQMYEVKGKVKKVTFFNVENKIDTEVTFNRVGQLLIEQNTQALMEYTYDENNKLLSLSMLGADGQKKGSRKYFYNEDEQLSKISEMDHNGSIQYELKYTYDENGNRVRGDLLTPYKDTVHVWEYGFNKKNKLVSEKRTRYNPTGKTSRRQLYVLDEKGELNQIKEFENDSVLMRERTYEIFNDVPLQVKIYNAWENESITFEYEFDSHGNWIKRKMKMPKNQEIEQTRKILYYED